MGFIPSSVAAGAMALSLLLAHQGAAIAGGSGSMNSYLAAHPISTRTGVPSVHSNTTLPPSVVRLVTDPCPANCDESGFNPNNWTVYHQSSRLLRCNQTVLLDFALFNALDDPDTHQTIRSCTANLPLPAENANSTTNGKSCLPSGSSTVIQEPVQLATNGAGPPGSMDDFESVSQQLAAFLAHQEPMCNNTIVFASSNSVSVGIFAGSGVNSVIPSVLQQFTTYLTSTGIPDSTLVQLCSAKNRSSKYSFGIIVNAQNDLNSVQDVVGTWASGQCITTYNDTKTWQNIAVTVPTLLVQANSTFGNRTSSNSTLSIRSAHRLHRRANCTTIQVVSGDTCTYTWNNCQVTVIC